jgi:hypothetical protein
MLRYGAKVGSVYKDGGLLSLDLKEWDAENGYPPSKDLDNLLRGNFSLLHQVASSSYARNLLRAKAQYFEHELESLCSRIHAVDAPVGARGAQNAWTNYFCDNASAFSVYRQYIEALSQNDTAGATRLYDQYVAQWNSSAGFYVAMDETSLVMLKYSVHCKDIGMCGYHIDW